MDIKFVGGLTLEEALNLAYEDDVNIRNIYIEPPDTAALTDEDSGDEDAGGSVDNLSRKQLEAKVELQMYGKEADEVEDEDQVRPERDKICVFEEAENKSEVVQGDVQAMDIAEEEIGSSTHNREASRKVEKIDYDFLDWVKGDLVDNPTHFPEQTYEQYKTLTPVEMFELFFDDDIINYILSESTNYALQKNFPDPQISTGEMRCFLAILILSGYNWLPGKKFYWDTEGDMGNKRVMDAMRRDRFLIIWRFFHVANNDTIDDSDKYYKIRPLADRLQKKFEQYYVPECELNYDESMVKYFGRHSCKQFIRGKPIRFGYKVWCLNTKSGYLVNFNMYQGSDPKANKDYYKVFGACAAPFVTMLDELPDDKSKLPYKFYCDNLFTSFHLLAHIKDRGFALTGTIRENRIPKTCPIVSKGNMQKRKRGDIESILERQTGIILVRWLDNNVVSMASTSDGVGPQSLVKRYSQAEKKIIQVPRPCLIGKYNHAMGGTDLMDENINRFRIGMRAKKWYWSLITWMLDVTIQNAWILHKKSGNKLTQLQFRRQIVLSYLIKYRVAARQGGRPASSASSRSSHRVSDDIRYDGVGHLLEPVPNQKKIRCAGEECKSIMRTRCAKCGVGLCKKCNVQFHTQL